MTTPVPGWSVKGIVPETTFSPGIGAQDGHRITFETGTGITGSIWIPAAQLSDRAAIADAIQSRVRELHDVHTLRG